MAGEGFASSGTTSIVFGHQYDLRLCHRKKEEEEEEDKIRFWSQNTPCHVFLELFQEVWETRKGRMQFTGVEVLMIDVLMASVDAESWLLVLLSLRAAVW